MSTYKNQARGATAPPQLPTQILKITPAQSELPNIPPFAMEATVVVPIHFKQPDAMQAYRVSMPTVLLMPGTLKSIRCIDNPREWDYEVLCPDLPFRDLEWQLRGSPDCHLMIQLPNPGNDLILSEHGDKDRDQPWMPVLKYLWKAGGETNRFISGKEADGVMFIVDKLGSLKQRRQDRAVELGRI